MVMPETNIGMGGGVAGTASIGPGGESLVGMAPRAPPVLSGKLFGDGWRGL